MQIFSAVNASDVNEYTAALKTFDHPKFHNHLSKGQRGCFLSHLKLYKHIVDNNIAIATIFEDDVYFHPQWSTLAPQYYKNTRSNYDVIFIGNQINKDAPRINHESTFCTHAYIITQLGARKLLNLLLKWDYNTPDNAARIGHSLDGLFAIDVIIKTIQDRMNTGKLRKMLNWYCWNGTKHPCNETSDGHAARNTGLVFQSSKFETLCTP